MADTRIHGTTRRHGRRFRGSGTARVAAASQSVPGKFEEARNARCIAMVTWSSRKRITPPHPNTSDARFGCGRKHGSCGFITRVGSRSRCMRWPNQEKFTTDPLHLHRPHHIIERGADYLPDRCRMIGPLTGTWAQAMHQTRGPQSLRVMQGLCSSPRNIPPPHWKSCQSRHASRCLALARSGASLSRVR